jgi:hypothetical protein
MVILIIKLAILFNRCIILRELILRLLHDIDCTLSWMKREPKKEILLKTIK